ARGRRPALLHAGVRRRPARFVQEPPRLAHRRRPAPLDLREAGGVDQRVTARGPLAHDSLRAVLDYAHARVVEDANTDVGVSAADIGPDGTVAAADLRAAIAGAMARLATAVVS